jgi:hypothetical protein
MAVPGGDVFAVPGVFFEWLFCRWHKSLSPRQCL